ncbi:Hypothetical Protein FCC1311_046262 [Hondaea fermentalgiana]|uniref:BAG domain-containing protein n=1 Tax=Hondaea fermentalgiana TaxID=2315210 RepID=A0A2R5GIC4_9STRA|nr:Hypothetical Protein FCC1311_046262 [Hondaea fermentalgiana]|eukprot:GBG28403.1 Hypothetical Protein FCC1311_046262 [Hondaea fermentalgiana]
MALDATAKPEADGAAAAAAAAAENPEHRAESVEEDDHDCAEDEDCEMGESDELAKEIEASRVKLQEIGKRVNLLTLKVSRSRERFRTQSAMVAGNVWMLKALKRGLSTFSKVATTSLVEDHGVMVETLMRELINLDAVESHGDESLRSRRRELVKRINGKVLPRADQALARAKKLAARDRELRALLQEQQQQQQQKQQKQEVEPKQESRELAMDTSDENEASTQSPENKSEPKQASEQTAARSPKATHGKKKGKKTSATKRPPAHAQSPLRYKIGENADEATILCEVPQDLTLRDVEVAFDRSSGELEVRLPNREPAVFDVSAPRVNPLATTYTLRNGVLRIAIPKRKPQRQNFNQARHVPQMRRHHPMQAAHHGFFDAPQRMPYSNQFVPLWGL